MSPVVTVRLLGPFEVLVDGLPVTVPGMRARSIVAVLALAAGRTVSVETVVDRVWGDDLPANPRASLHAAVRRLRLLLGADSIVTDESGYALAIDAEAVDAVAFTRYVEAVDGDRSEARLAAALALWRGTPFEGEFCDRLTRYEAPRLVERYLSALERRIDLDLAAGRHAALVGELRELTEVHPLREPLWTRLLLAMDAAGRSAEALEEYGVIRERIAEELGVDPGPKLQQVYADLLAGAGGPADAASAPAAVPQQLPSDLQRFTGRASALAALDELLGWTGVDRPVVVAVLHGEGGVGKTSLAVHWAHQVAGEFPDGRLFVNLRGYGPGEPVSTAAALGYLLRSLGIAADGIPDTDDERSALLRTTLSGRRVLLVLDDARSAEQIRALLPGTGALVLVTSRSRLGGLAARDGAQQVSVDELSVSEARSLMLELTKAKRLSIDADELDELAELCNYLPLALSIVAEQLTREEGLEVEELVRQLRDQAARLDALDIGDDPTTNLRAVFSWSYRTLDDDTARMFRLLALHPGPSIGVPAAAALAGTTVPRARRLLDRLVDLHLLRKPMTARFQLHDLLRAYAAEQTAAPDDVEVRDQAMSRLLRWYLHSASAAVRWLTPSTPLSDAGPHAPDISPLVFDGEDAALQWFDAERPSLQGGIRLATELGNHALSCRLGLTLWTHLEMRFPPADATAVHGAALRSARLAGDARLEAIAANQLGTSHGRAGQIDHALPQLEQALALFATVGHRRGELVVMGNLGLAHRLRGDHAEALAFAMRALDLARRWGIPDEEATIRTNLVLTYVALERYDDAVREARAAVDRQRVAGVRRDLAYALDALGVAQTRAGDPAAAIEHLTEAVKLNRETGNLGSTIIALVNLGTAHERSGDDAAALDRWREALDAMDAQEVADFDEVRRCDVLAMIQAHDPATGPS